MISIGNDELEKAPKLGDFILCKECGKRHRIKTSYNENKTISIQSYKCGSKSYMVGINGKSIQSRK